MIILLGIIQGIAEFLPISSTAHLILFPYFFNYSDPGLSFDIMLHLGTLLAILVCFWQEWWGVIYGFLRIIKNRRVKDIKDKQIFYIAIGSVPAAVLGFIFNDYASTYLRQPILIALMLVIFGIILYLTDTYSKHTKTRLNLHWQQALIIGFGQALAIIPGVSRSGATISAGRLLGLEREEATKFSFMLSAPIIFGAVMSYIANQRFGIFDANSIVGLTVSFVTAMVAIKWILGYLKTADFTLFIWYRFILAGIIVIIFILKNNYLV